MKYLTLDEVKQFIGLDLTYTDDDQRLMNLIENAEEFVEAYLGQTWDTTESTLTFSTDDGVSVDFYPHAFYTVSSVVYGPDNKVLDLSKVDFYPLNPPYFYMELSDDTTETLENPVKVTGTQGFGPLPNDVKVIMMRIVQHWYRTFNFHDQAQILPDGTYVRDTSKLPNDITQMLDTLASRV